MYTRLLIPLDSSEVAERVLPYARSLAEGLKAPIELLCIIEPVSPELTDPKHQHACCGPGVLEQDSCVFARGWRNGVLRGPRGGAGLSDPG